MTNSPIEIIVVDDHQIVLDGISAMFLTSKDIKIIGTALNAEKLWKLLRQRVPHVILLDMNLPAMNGLEIAQKIRTEQPAIRLLVLSANSDKQSILAAVKAGVHGFLPKECSKEELIKGIEMVIQGQHYFGATIAPIVYQSFANQLSGESTAQTPSVLTEREIEIVQGFANGKTYKEIGNLLFISPRTVETHKKNIFKKLGFQNQADLIKYAIKHGIIKL
ncbi:response regulator [Aureispira anguillae]|uniref:Response regulator transcription factor n=1 Tax=Aureispira anguillae TaxID=2864201 RepID=A0A915YCA8_9BACT|nr:response regulator transcription factor [Aureispira anguillae]BDS10460.1 response regulator transcription factor [Aureispira anguillae]